MGVRGGIYLSTWTTTDRASSPGILFSSFQVAALERDMLNVAHCSIHVLGGQFSLSLSACAPPASSSGKSILINHRNNNNNNAEVISFLSLSSRHLTVMRKRNNNRKGQSPLRRAVVDNVRLDTQHYFSLSLSLSYVLGYTLL